MTAMDTTKRGYLLIIGGGRSYNDSKDGPADWTASVYNWMIERVPSGRIAILDRVDDDLTDAYVEMFKKLGATQAFKVVPTTRELADQPQLASQIEESDGVYIIGGDQWRHMLAWKGTLTEKAIQAVFQKGGVVSGNSSGAHLLSEFILDARHSLEYGGHRFWSDHSLMNPYGLGHTYTDDFLGLLPNTTVDTHTTERGRLARLATSVARIYSDHGRSVVGVGIDKFTGFAVNPDLTAEVLGHGYVMLMALTTDSIVHCREGQPLALTDLRYHQLTRGFSYDLKSHSVIEVPDYAVEYPPLEPSAEHYQRVELDGFYEETALLGDVFIDGPVFSDMDAWMKGRLSLQAGWSQVPGVVLAPKMFSFHKKLNPDIKWTWSNQQTGLSAALAQYPGKVGVMVPVYVVAEVDEEGYLHIDETEENEITSLIVLDGSELQAVAFASHFKGGQSPALVNAWLHILTDDMEFDLLKRRAYRLRRRALGWTLRHVPQASGTAATLSEPGAFEERTELLER